MLIPVYRSHNHIVGCDTLLIACGDSWTEGIGNYDPAALEDYLNRRSPYLDIKALSYKMGSFFENSWPLLVAKKLNWDVINLGEGGSSNPGMAKKLLNEFSLDYNSENFKRYKKIIVFVMLSGNNRVSFYRNQSLAHLLLTTNPTGHYLTSGDCKAWLEDYYRLISIHPNDAVLETRHSVRAIEMYCKANNFTFVFGSGFAPVTPLAQIYESPANIHRHLPHQYFSRYLTKASFKRFPLESQFLTDEQVQQYRAAEPTSDVALCWHPNKTGYAKIAEVIATTLSAHYI